MSFVQKLIKPTISLNRFKDFIVSKEMIAVASAILITPVLLGTITAIVSRFPLIRDNVAIGLAVASFILFAIAMMFSPTGILRSVLIGVAAGTLITGIQSTTFAQNILGRLGGGQ